MFRSGRLSELMAGVDGNLEENATYYQTATSLWQNRSKILNNLKKQGDLFGTLSKFAGTVKIVFLLIFTHLYRQEMQKMPLNHDIHVFLRMSFKNVLGWIPGISNIYLYYTVVDVS